MTTSPKCFPSRFATSSLLALWAFFFSFLALAQDDPAQQLVARLRSEAPTEDSLIRGVIHIRSGDARTNIPIVCKVQIDGDSWRSIYQSDSELLIVVHSTNGPNQYLRSISGGPTNAIGDTAACNFANSDFSADDLGLEFLHWPNQKLLKGEMRLGQPCDVLESSPPPARSAISPIDRVRSYIDKQSGGIIEAEGFDKDGRVIKEFSLHGSFFRKVNGQWRLEKMEMTDKLKHSQTIIQFDIGK